MRVMRATEGIMGKVQVMLGVDVRVSKVRMMYTKTKKTQSGLAVKISGIK